MKGVVDVAPIHLDALAELFRACECPCFCQYWHFEGDKNAWLERCAQSPEVNESALRADVGRGEAAAGLVALDDSRVMGWMKLAPRATLPNSDSVRRKTKPAMAKSAPSKDRWSASRRKDCSP